MTASLAALACPRCGRGYAETEAWFGCPACRDEGFGVNLQPQYASVELRADGGPGLFRWGPLPLSRRVEPISLSEGNTPLLRVDGLGLDRLFVKDETRNPTWSYKDRLAAVAVTKAKELGADTVVTSTTGNHGAAVSAYAAAGGLRSVILTLTSVPDTMRTLMQAYGAQVVMLDRSSDRWTLMEQAVRELGWVPMSNFQVPVVGSNPFGVDGYKTIAYELWEALGGAPDVVVVPTAYADGLTGIYRGFRDLVGLGLIAQVPRMVAAEPLGPYEATLASGDEAPVEVDAAASVAFSTATPVASYQGLWALRNSAGAARAVGDDATVLDAQLRLAGATGIYVEAASAVALPVVERLAGEGWIGRDETVVVIATSSGLKDPAVTRTVLPDVPRIEPELTALEEALAST